MSAALLLSYLCLCTRVPPFVPTCSSTVVVYTCVAPDDSTRANLRPMSLAPREEGERGRTECYVGVKPFERALALLVASSVEPKKSTHPLVDGEEQQLVSAVPWDKLHPKVHPSGAGVPASRAGRKCWQLESICAIAQLLAKDRASGSMHIVDFAGGSGQVGLPLAALLPWAKVTVVELKKQSLDIARERAAAASLSNVAFFEGDLCSFAQPFDLGMALHACGAASDLVLQACVAARARFVVCPCCTGKLSASRRDNYRQRATNGSEAPRVQYPLSATFETTLTAEQYDHLACAADVSDAFLLDGPRGLLRRLCKAYLELDRQLWAREQGYETCVTRMHRRDATPKADIVYGWPAEDPPAAEVVAALTRTQDDPDFAQAKQLGFGRDAGRDDASGMAGACGSEGLSLAETRAPSSFARQLGGALCASEWTESELSGVVAQLQAAKDGEVLVIHAPTPRQRRLVHVVADMMGLHHESDGGRSRRGGDGQVRVRRLSDAAAQCQQCAPRDEEGAP